MKRSFKYLDDVEVIANSLSFLQNANEEKKQLLKDLNEYQHIVNSNANVFSKFPLLTHEIKSTLNINNFNSISASNKIEEINKMLPKLSYMSDMIDNLDEIKNPALEAKINLSVSKSRFQNDASKLIQRSIDTLYFEMQKFEQLFKTTAASLNAENQKRQKVKSLIAQDSPLLSHFPNIKTEFQKILEGETIGMFGLDYVLTNYSSIRNNISVLNEHSIYFAKLSKDYQLILNENDLTVFQQIKTLVSLNNLNNDFLRLNTKATEFKNKMVKLDTFRNQFSNLKKELQTKKEELSENHQKYVDAETKLIQELLFEKVGHDFEKAGVKIITINELLRKGFKTNPEKATEALYIRQAITKYEFNMWQEDMTLLYEELNNYVNGKSGWTKDDFNNTVQKFIIKKNENVEEAKKIFDLFLTKNREYRNKLEKLVNTRSSKKDFDEFIKEMNSFKLVKGIFYKFVK